jgi:hypothetical protein
VIGEELSLQPQLLLPVAQPPSLQTLVDERRDHLRARREALFDTIGARYAYMSPWMVTHDRTMDAYQEAMRQLHRRQRDYAQLHHDAWMDAMSPGPNRSGIRRECAATSRRWISATCRRRVTPGWRRAATPLPGQFPGNGYFSNRIGRDDRCDTFYRAITARNPLTAAVPLPPLSIRRSLQYLSGCRYASMTAHARG